jgi:type VI secretion system protein ImpB
MSSINNKLERVRKPRVHIKYEVETEDSVVSKELPFVVGVLGDFSGDSTEPQKPLRERKFVQIDRDNFDEVMQRMTPGAKFSVANTIQNDNSELAVDLKFSSIEDFEPAKVAEQIPAVKNLLDTRNKLRDLLTKVDRSEDLESLLEKVLQNSEELQKFSQELSK